jgi:protein required for attachment to host cells
MSSRNWVVVADSARALVFTLNGHTKSLLQIREMSHPESRMRDLELVGDKPGRAFERVGQVRHAVTQAFDPRTVEKRKFGLEVAMMLDHARKEGMVDKIVIVAAPGFLGDLRSNLTDKTTKLIAREIPKDLVHMTVWEIQEHLPTHLFE